eukprot:7240507-Pyramimonas_sp.AAC.1
MFPLPSCARSSSCAGPSTWTEPSTCPGPSTCAGPPTCAGSSQFSSHKAPAHCNGVAAGC